MDFQVLPKLQQNVLKHCNVYFHERHGKIWRRRVVLPGWCTPPCVSAWFNLCKRVWSSWVRICLDLCVTTAKLLAMLNTKEPNNTPCSYRSLHGLFFAVLFFYTCLKPAWDIRGIPFWLCNMIWGGQREKRKRKKKREREGEVCPAGFHVLLCTHISQPAPRLWVAGLSLASSALSVACLNLSCVL